MKPAKSATARAPLRPPPSSAELARSGLGHAKLYRSGTEDPNEAYRRALTMPWGGRIEVKRPYMTSGMWVFIVRLEREEAA